MARLQSDDFSSEFRAVAEQFTKTSAGVEIATSREKCPLDKTDQLLSRVSLRVEGATTTCPGLKHQEVSAAQPLAQSERVVQMHA